MSDKLGINMKHCCQEHVASIHMFLCYYFGE